MELDLLHRQAPGVLRFTEHLVSLQLPAVATATSCVSSAYTLALCTALIYLKDNGLDLLFLTESRK